MSHHKTETLVVKWAPGPYLVQGDGRPFFAETWVTQAIADLPPGAEVHLVLRVLDTPEPDGWYDATKRTPQPGKFVEVRLENGATEIGRIIDDLWLGDSDRVLFTPVAAWREVQ